MKEVKVTKAKSRYYKLIFDQDFAVFRPRPAVGLGGQPHLVGLETHPGPARFGFTHEMAPFIAFRKTPTVGGQSKLAAPETDNLEWWNIGIVEFCGSNRRADKDA